MGSSWKRWAWRSSLAAAVCVAVGVNWVDRPGEEWDRGFLSVDALSAATPAGTSVVGLIASDYERLDDPVPRDRELTEAQVEGMVRYAVAMAGGLQHRIEPDAEWVVIKPNIVELKERGSGVITDWRVVKALIKIVHETVPEARVTIAEGGAWVPPEHQEVLRGGFGGGEDNVGDGFAVAGFRQLLQDPELQGVKLDIVDLNFDEPVEIPVPDGGYVFETYKIPNTIVECDFLITVPVLKIIGGVSMTNAMKNFVGIAPGMVYGWPKMQGYPPGGPNPGLPHNPGILDEVIVDLTSVAEADFAVVDALVGMERAKTDEDEGVRVRLNTIVASADIVATDAVSARLIGMNPDDLEYVTLAAYRGLGQGDMAHIKIKGSDIDQVGRRFEKYHGGRFYGGNYGQGARTWLLKGPFESKAAAADREFIDVRSPGALPGDNGWSQPVYFHDDQIDLDRYYDDPFNCAVYAYTDFTVPADQEAELWVGSDEGLRIWIDGEPVYEHRGRRRHQLPNDKPRIQLRAGTHALLVRCDQSRSRFDFSLNICEVEEDERYSGNRVAGLKFAVPASPAGDGAQAEGEELAFPHGGASIPEDATLIPDARFARHYDLLLGSLEGCLTQQGVEVSPVDLIGGTGHAFRLCVADSLEMRGSFRSDVASVIDLYQNLGRQIRLISLPADAPRFADRQIEAWEAMRESIDRGVPALARFGPFFWVVKGYHQKKEQCYISAFRGDEEAVELADLGTDEELPGLDVLLLGEARPADPAAGARKVIAFAVAEARRPPQDGTHWGLDGYRHWIGELEGERVEHDFLMRILVGVTNERRAQAAPYLRQVAPLFPADVAARLQAAAAAYDEEMQPLGELAAALPLFGPPGQAGAPIDLEDAAGRARAVDLVRKAMRSEEKAVAELEQAAALIR